MQYLTNTDQLVHDGILNREQAREIELRSRETMVTLAINCVLVGGIIAATLGLIFWLADPVTVAVAGFLALVAGVLVLLKGSETYLLFGNAAALIGTGLLLGGGGIELFNRIELEAAPYLLGLGTMVMAGAIAFNRTGGSSVNFLSGSITLMGAAMHLTGLMMLEPDGAAAVMSFGYSAALIFVLGLMIDVRVVTALVVVPLAQMLDTSTAYFHAMYVFYSPEPTLSIIQMAVVIGLCLWSVERLHDRFGRHFGIVLMLSFVVMNLCFLVGSLWGDVPGDTIWGVSYYDRGLYDDYSAYIAAKKAFRETAFAISAGAFAIIWAIVLAAVAIWSAFTNRRGPMNAALTFAAIHAYTQAFETFGAEPAVFAIGGLAAIPVAWGLIQINAAMKARDAA